MTLLLQWAYLIRLVIIVAYRAHIWVRLRMILFLGIINSTFQHCERWSIGIKFPGQYEIDFFHVL